MIVVETRFIASQKTIGVLYLRRRDESRLYRFYANVNNRFPKKFHSVEAPTANTLLR